MQADAHAPQGRAVTLEEVLDRREARVADRQAWLARFGRPLVSLTLVFPGPQKDTAVSRYLFDEGDAAIGSMLARAGWGVLAKANRRYATGPEGMQAVDAEAEALKRTLVALEDSHPLGRLWDADVIDTAGASVTRRQLGMPARACLLCGEPAHACARAGNHALADLQRAIMDRVDAYRGHLVR